MKRISVTHEVVAPGVSREQQNFNGILLSFFTEIKDNLIKEDYTSYEKDKKEIAPEVELLFRQRGTVKMHLFSMRNIDGSLIGIMGVDYTEDKVSLSEKEVQYLKVRANLLAGYVIHGKVEIK